MSGLVDMVTGAGARRAAAAQAALQKRQEAIQARQQLSADRRETELAGQQAALTRVAAARRRGRGQLAYNGLKTTLGG